MNDHPSVRSSSRELWSIYGSASAGQRFIAALRPIICPLAPIVSLVPNEATVLDIGCGNGLYLTALSRFRGIRLGVGVDINGDAIRTANRISTANRLPLEFKVATIKDWPRGSFDVVSMIDVMHHLPGSLRRQFFSEALRRVSVNGHFLYKDMCARPWWRKRWNEFHDLLSAQQRVRVEPIANVIRWGTEEGFEVVVQRSYVACLLYGHEFLLLRRQSTPVATPEGRN